RIRRPKHRTDDRDNGGTQQPLRRDQDGQSLELCVQPGTRRIAHDDPQDNPADRDQDGLAQDDIHDVELSGAQRFQDADFAGALHDGGVHRLEDHDEADDHRDPDDHVDERGEPGHAARTHQTEVFLQRVNAVLLHAGNAFDLVDDGVSIVGIVELDVEDRGLALRANDVLQGRDGEKFARALAVLHDAGNAKGMIQGFDGVAYLELLRRGDVVVDQHVGGAFERSTCEVVERPAHAFKRLEVDAVNDFQIAGGGKLSDDRSNSDDVLEFAQLVGNLDRHRRAADAHDERRARRLHHDVGSDANLAVLGVGEHADGQADDQ